MSQIGIAAVQSSLRDCMRQALSYIPRRQSGDQWFELMPPTSSSNVASWKTALRDTSAKPRSLNSANDALLNRPIFARYFFTSCTASNSQPSSALLLIAFMVRMQATLAPDRSMIWFVTHLRCSHVLCSHTISTSCNAWCRYYQTPPRMSLTARKSGTHLRIADRVVSRHV